MKTLKQLQNELLAIRTESEKAYSEYYDLTNEIDDRVDNEEITEEEGIRLDTELIIKLRLNELDNKHKKAINDLKDYCYKEFKKVGKLNDDIEYLFEKSKKNVVTENKLVDFLLTV